MTFATPTPLSDVRAAAAMAGASSFEIDGDGNPCARFRTGWGAARYLLELARKDSRREWVRELAMGLRTIGGGSDEGFARVLHAYGRSLPFFAEQGEIFQGPALTAKRGGDCDCHARLLYGLAKAGGLPTELGFMHKPGGMPTHVFVRVFVNGRWSPIETTVAADFGENPFSAARRLGVVRPDMASPEVVTMGDITNGDCPDQDASEGDELGADDTVPDQADDETMAGFTLTADLSPGFFTRIKKLGADRNINPASLIKMFQAESGLNAAQPSHVKDKNGNPVAFGISQIMNLHGVGFPGTPADYLSLTAEQQLEFVDRFYAPHTRDHLDTDERLYQANFLPATLPWGSDPDLVLARKEGGGRFDREFGILSGRQNPLPEHIVYRDNAGLDHDRKGFITVGDLGFALRRAGNAPKAKEALARLELGAGHGGSAAIVLLAFAGAGAFGVLKYLDLV